MDKKPDRYEATNPALLKKPDRYEATNPVLLALPGQYDPNVTINSLGLIPPTTPPSHNPGVDIPGANPINYKNLPVPPVQATRPALGWRDIIGGVYRNTKENLGKFLDSAYETWNHPIDSYHALTNGLPSIDSVESAVNAAPKTIAGMALSQFSPEVRAALVKDHPELQPAVEQAKTVNEQAKNAAGAVANYLGTYAARPGEPMGTGLEYNLKDRPWQTLSDLSLPAQMAVTGGGALADRVLGGAGVGLGEMVTDGLIGHGVPAGIAKAVAATPNAAAMSMNPLNALIPAGKVVSASSRKFINAMTPQRMLLNAARENPELAAQILAKQDEAVAHPIVPGSAPTAGEALGPNPLNGYPMASAAPTAGPQAPINGPTVVPGGPTMPNPAGAPPNHPAAAQALGINPATVQAMLLAAPSDQEAARMAALKPASTAVVPAGPTGVVPQNALARPNPTGLTQETGVVPASPTGVDPYYQMPGNQYSIDPRSQLPSGAGFPATPPGTPQGLSGAANPAVPAPAPGTPNAGSPGINAANWAQMVKDAETNKGTDFINLREANNNARIAHIGSTMAQTPEVLQQAIANHLALSDNTNPATLYGRAHRMMTDGDATLMDLLNRPLSNGVVDRARNNLGESRIPFQTGTYIPADPSTGAPAVYPRYSGQALEAIKKSFDDLAFDPNVVSKSGISGSDSQRIRNTRDQFLQWVGQSNKNPDLVQAMNEYRDRMHVINQMKLGQYFQNLLSNPLTPGHTIDQRLGAFSSALDNPLKDWAPTGDKGVLLNATGSKMADHLEDIASPQQMQMLHSIKADLERESFDASRANSQPFAGKLNTAASDQWNMKDMKGAMSILPDSVNALTGIVTGGANKRISDRVGNALKNPAETAQMLRNADAQQNLLDKTGAFIRNGATMTNNLTNRIPTTYNVIEQQRDAKKKKDNQ